jgi:4-diphosphocytidyl-2-C-methyl-D-erythritol kinase
VVQACAKINPLLRVLGRRGDGFHELETLILPVTLCDELRVHAVADPTMFRTQSLGLDVDGDPELTRAVPADETNLAMRAAMALADRFAPSGFADITLTKRIPAAAGLGGGSADAAATLRALNVLWGLAIGDADLSEIAAEVGSDVPALLAGRPVMAGGRGERITPVPAAPFGWMLVTFPFGVRTKDAFRWWDEDGGAASTGSERGPLLDAVATGDPGRLGPLLRNDLEEPVLARHRDIRRVRDLVLGDGLPGAVLCGSGGTLAGLLPAGAQPTDVAALTGELVEITGREPVFVRSVAGEGPGPVDSNG